MSPLEPEAESGASARPEVSAYLRATLDSLIDDLNLWLSRADRALYEAKESGRNSVGVLP